MTDLREQLRAMPSSLNDACRTMEVAANQIDVLMKALRDALVDLNHARIFIRTREKMHPIGVKQFDETVDRLTALVGGPRNG